MERKKGQVQLSFGMIFSIIVVIAVVAVGFYVIKYFLSLSNCTNVGLFYQGLQKEVDQAWASSTSKSLFSGSLPGSVEYACFGNLTQTARSADVQMANTLRDKYKFAKNENIFLYPLSGSCQTDLGKKVITHAETDGFFCSAVKEGKVQVSIYKGSNNALAQIQPA